MKIKEMCLCALMSVLIIIGAFIKVPISVLPITLQTLFIFLACFVLKQKAVYSVLLYIIMGLIGLPVFISGGGPSYILMPSFGYLLGFIVCSYYVGHSDFKNIKLLILKCIIGLLMIYIIGILYFIMIEYFYYGQIFELNYLFYSLFLVYLPGDLLSLGISYIIYQRLKMTKRLI